MKKNFVSMFLVGFVFLLGGISFADQGDLVASKKSDKYHLATCPVAKQITADNLIKFKSPEEAIKAGYAPCQKCNPSSKTASFIGSKNSAVYHLPACPLARKILAENAVNFSSKEQAAKAGYKPCQICFPSDSKSDSSANKKLSDKKK